MTTIGSRHDLEEIQGIRSSVPNHRDASIPGSSKAWQREKPTPISVPSASAPRGGFNPFSVSRMQDNLHGNNKQQNRSTARTSITSTSNNSRPVKRRKINDSKPSGTSNSRSKLPPIAPEDNNEVIILDDGPEDVGQRIAQPSSEELDIPTRMPSVKRPEKHAFDEDKPTPDSGIEFLRNKHGRSTSPIESFASPVPKRGTVKNIVSRIEKRNELAQPDKIPRIDLRAKLKMKSKDNKTQGRLPPQRPPDAPFNPTLPAKEKVKEGEWMLPLKDYMLGTEHIEEKCTIHVNKKRGTFELRNGNLSAKSKIFQIDRDFNQFQGMERDREHPVFALRSTYDKTAGVKKSARFVPGDKGQKGQLCVRFDKGHPKWHGNSFDNTLAWFKANIKDSSIVRHDTALWNAACAPDSDPVDIDTAPENWSPPPVESVSASTSRKSKPGQQNTGLLHANGKIKSSSVVVYEPTPESISAPRRSTRHSDAPPKPPEEEPDELILVYPWGTTGGVNLSKSDLNRLKPGEYLNDNLIELGLKMWHSRLEKENPELANEIYVFSSFFYKKLSVKNADEGYNAVRRWTSKTNIFAKKYIIVPINENFHWYLAIIYQPEHILLPPLQITSPATRGRTRQSIVTPASPLADPLREISPEATLDDSPVSAHVFSSEAQEAHDVEELLRLSQSFNIEEDSIEGTTTEVHDVDMREPLDDDTNMDIDEEIPAGFRRRSLSVTADDRPRGQSSSFVPEDENIRSDEAQVTASGSESQPLSPQFEGERSDVIDIDTAHSLFDGDDDVESASTHIEESVSCPGGIPPSRFYASDKKGKRKAEPQSDPVIVAEDAQSPQKGKLKTYSLRKRKAEDDADTQVEVPDDDEVTVLDGRPSTYIFTMDSLGSRHPRVISVLGNYLRLEAIDKKGIEATSKPFGKQALVPVQPNFCDCGIYLIHFAQTFMSDPTRYCSIITARKGSDNMQKDRKAVWKAEDIGGMRENLRDQLLGLSKEWRVWKSKEKEKDDITMIESSDSEVDIVEVETTPAPSTAGQAKGKTRGGGKGGKRK